MVTTPHAARDGGLLAGGRMEVDGSPDELAALYRIAGLRDAGRDEPQLVGDVLKLAADVVACERSLLFLYEPEAEQFRVYSGDGNGGREISASKPTIIRRIFHSDHGEVLNDVVSDPDSNPAASELLEARQLAAAPLEAGGQRLGVIAALNSKRATFEEKDLRLLSSLADRAAVTIQNARLHSLMERQTQELTGLHRLSRLLASAETVDFAIGESVRIVSDLLECEKAAILLYDEKAESLVAHPPGSGMTPEEIDGLRVPLVEPSLAGTVFRTDTPLISNHAATDAWLGQRLRSILDAETMLVVPLTFGSRPIGVLQAVNAKKGNFDDNDLRFTTLLGGRIASVIEASRSRERERGLLQKLREADRTKNEFVSMLAHELNSPMTAIKGFGDALREQSGTMPEEQRRRFLDILATEIGRLARLVNDLLDVSRMEAGALRYELEPLSLQGVVNDLLASHPSLAAAHVLESRVPRDVPLVLGDKDRIRQVLLNLLTNATRYAPEETTITITAETLRGDDAGYVKVGVADEGIGIAPEHRESVFSKFVMLPKPSSVKQGTGLGLFITKSIVEGHGGRIWVESEPGRGSTFYFSLRVA